MWGIFLFKRRLKWLKALKTRLKNSGVAVQLLITTAGFGYAQPPTAYVFYFLIFTTATIGFGYA